MKTIVIDTNILIDYVNSHALWLEEILASEKKTTQLVLPTIVIAEYFASTVLEEEKEVRIADKTFAIFTKQDLTEEIARILGSILRHKSYPSGASLADLVIAATALFLDAELATRNKADFAKIPHLRFFDPKQYHLKE